MMIFVSRIFHFFERASRRLIMYLKLPLFRRCGSNVVIGHGGIFSYSSIELGDFIYIGPYATFSAAKSKIIIKNKVMFGPHVKIMGGDHRTDVVGRYMFDIGESEKLPENDADVIIESDVWIGTNAVILKGVTIGRGSVIGANSLVARSVPPYSIVVGNPGRVVKMRFTEAEIELHERILG